MRKMICYQSNPKRTFTVLELELLLHEAKKNNDKNRIRGTLIFHNTTFFQILEGDHSILNPLYNKIKQDPRHKNIIELFNAPIQTIVFNSFDTGYSPTDDINALYGLHKYVDIINQNKLKNGDLFLNFVGSYLSLKA